MENAHSKRARHFRGTAHGQYRRVECFSNKRRASEGRPPRKFPLRCFSLDAPYFRALVSSQDRMPRSPRRFKVESTRARFQFAKISFRRFQRVVSRLVSFARLPANESQSSQQSGQYERNTVRFDLPAVPWQRRGSVG